jgi:hypothetical protein
MEFKLFFEDEMRTAGKTILYPLGYGGIGLYPDAAMMSRSADAVLYLTTDKRLYKNGDATPFSLKALPGHKQYGDKINNGEKKPFSIEFISKKQPKPSYQMPQGKIKSFKDFVKLVTDPKEITPKCGKIPEAL